MHSVLDLRVYRAAFLPALLALFVLAFSLEGRPAPARTRDVADAFDPNRAYGTTQVRDSLIQLGTAFPDRRPGSAGDEDLAGRVDEVMRAAGFDVSRTSHEGRTVDGTRVARHRRRRAARPVEPPDRRPGAPRLARLARARRPVGHRRAARAGAHLPHEAARLGGRAASGRAPAARRARPAQDARARLDVGRERRRRRRARLGAGAGRRADRRRAGARRPGVRPLAEAVGGAVVQRALASRRSAGSAPWRRRRARRSAPIRAARARARSGRVGRSR